MRTIVRTDRNLAHAISEVSQIVPDEQRPMQVSISKYRRSKTREQLGYLFGPVLGTIQKHIEDSTGEHYTTDDIYSWMIDEYGEDKVVAIDGKPKHVKLTASRMNTLEMHNFIEKVIQHAATKMDLVIPDAQ